MFSIVFFLISVTFQPNSAVIFSLNETIYNSMPPLYALDDFSSCLLDSDGVYCVVDVDLYSRDHSELMYIIQEYSAHSIKHFNHTQIHRGVCVTTTCKKFTSNTNITNTAVLNSTLEACLNDSLWRTYHLEGKLANVNYCKRKEERLIVDTSDFVVASIYFVIILLNVVGSSYDFWFCQEKKANPYLLAFSIQRNWAGLIRPSEHKSEPRLDRLKLFHGIRTMTMICVFFSHTVLIMSLSYVNNPLYIEKSYEDPLKQILFNGSLVIHTFFVMSSFLLAFKFQLHSETNLVKWLQLPKGIFMRWLRLTPTYALILATISTWMRYAGSGPLWDLVVVSEAAACRRFWWAHLLYINNYVYEDNLCAPQTWYLAADLQLFCIGLAVCIAARSARAQKIVLGTMFAASLVITALHTYFQDLNAVVIQAPELYRSLYAHDDTFRLLYIRGHTNLSTYILGLVGGLLTFHWQKQGKSFGRFKRYRILYWLTVPLGLLVMLSGYVFYSDEGPPAAPFPLLYATLYKPLFQLFIVIIIVGCVFKFENVYRKILEWRGFTWTGRVSYSAFLLHTLFQRGLVGIQTSPTHMSDYYVLTVLTSDIFLPYLCAVPLYVMVESPAMALTRASCSHASAVQVTRASGELSSAVEKNIEASNV